MRKAEATRTAEAEAARRGGCNDNEGSRGSSTTVKGVDPLNYSTGLSMCFAPCFFRALLTLPTRATHLPHAAVVRTDDALGHKGAPGAVRGRLRACIMATVTSKRSKTEAAAGHASSS